MSNLQTPFRYDFVGSFLRPEKLKKARRQFDEGKIDAAALKEVEEEEKRENQETVAVTETAANPETQTKETVETEEA